MRESEPGKGNRFPLGIELLISAVATLLESAPNQNPLDLAQRDFIGRSAAGSRCSQQFVCDNRLSVLNLAVAFEVSGDSSGSDYAATVTDLKNTRFYGPLRIIEDSPMGESKPFSVIR